MESAPWGTSQGGVSLITCELVLEMLMFLLFRMFSGTAKHFQWYEVSLYLLVFKIPTSITKQTISVQKQKLKKLQKGQKIWLMDTTLSLACCCHFCKALIQIYLSHTLLFQRLFVSIMTKTPILGRCGARFLLPSGAPSKCEASHSTCCSARGWWVSSWRCWWSPWWCSRCSSSPEDCMCDDCLYYEWEDGGQGIAPARSRARQNGDHRDYWSRKVWIFDGKLYLSFTPLCLLFDGKTVSVTKKYIITNHLMIIGMILMIIRISLPKTK